MGIRPVRRKFHPGAASDLFDPTTGECTIDYFLARKDVFRAVAHPYITTCRPSEYSDLEVSRQAWKRGDGKKNYLRKCGLLSPAARAIVEELEEKWKEILSQYSINVKDWSLVALGEWWCLDSHRNTLVIQSQDTDPLHWDDAATKIQELLDEACTKRNEFMEFPKNYGSEWSSGPSKQDEAEKAPKKYRLDIRVEIRNKDLMFEPCGGSFRPGPILEAVRAIQRRVEDKIYELIPEWTTIGFDMTGEVRKACEERWRWPNYDLTVWRPSLRMSVRPGTRMQWEKVEGQICELLTEISAKMEIQFDFDLDVEMYSGVTRAGNKS